MVLIAIAAAVIAAALLWRRSLAKEERRWNAELRKVAEDADADVHCSYIGEPREGDRG
jgi:hypothetical protein